MHAIVRWATITAVLIVAATSPPHAASSLTIHVPGDYPTIQQGLDAAQPGDLVLVAPGTYYENVVMHSGHDGVALVSEAGPAVTVIDGSDAGRVFTCANLGPDTRIEGFTIQHGRAEPFTSDNLGGGMLLDHCLLEIQHCVIRASFAEAAGGLYLDWSPVVIADTIVEGNEALGSGGGIYCDHASHALIDHCTVTDNTCGHFGGGITIWQDSAAQVRHSTISGNHAAAGGGFYVDQSQPEIRSNTIEHNIGDGSGGGIYLDHFSGAAIEHNVIAFNECGHHGAGITIWAGSSPTITNNTFVHNDASWEGGGVFVNMNSHPIAEQNIIAGNLGGGIRLHDTESTVGFACNDVWQNGGYDYSGMPDMTGTDGNISDDPMFCDPGAMDWTLSSLSPCTALNSPPGCALIGALDIGCGPVAVAPVTWGRLKAEYR